MPVTKQSVSLPPDLVKEMQGRGDSLSGAITKHLTRYLELMLRERATLRELLSEGEVSLVFDVLNGTAMLDQHSPAYIPLEVADGIKYESLDTKWRVDGHVLVGKLSTLDYAALAALADAAERFWARVGAGEDVEAMDTMK